MSTKDPQLTVAAIQVSCKNIQIYMERTNLNFSVIQAIPLNHLPPASGENLPRDWYASLGWALGSKMTSTQFNLMMLLVSFSQNGEEKTGTVTARIQVNIYIIYIQLYTYIICL